MCGVLNFVDPEKGDFRLKDGSIAFSVGFKNFAMDSFGVVSDELKKMAKTPDIPELFISQNNAPGKVYDWWGGKVKNIETLGEQSANGLSSMRGVLILNVPEGSHVPEGSRLAKQGFVTSDVIIKCEGEDIRTFEQLLQAIDTMKGTTYPEIYVMRDQKIRILRIMN